MEHKKVVQLENANRKPALPPIVQTVRQQSRRQLKELVDQLFNGTDDALFELADRSQNDSDQNMYFDSMREIRLQRSLILKSYTHEIYQRFEDLFVTTDPSTRQAKSESDSLADMTLVQDDDMEVSVAVAGIVSKVTGQQGPQLLHLTTRFNHICTLTEITEKNNPLGPEQLSQAFVAAISTADVDIKIRLILLKLYERLVMGPIGEILDHANQLLSEAGVLTDIESALYKSASKYRQPGHSGHTGALSDKTADTALTLGGPSMSGTGMAGIGALTPYTTPFTALQGLLNNHSGSLADSAQRTGSGSSLPPGAMITTPQLLDVISRLQSEAQIQPIALDTQPAPVDLRQILQATASKVTGDVSTALDKHDDDAVNLVGMVFDFILNDRNLAIPMKALIARLQITYVKVAILDKSFFEHASHPARLLLNELSSAGIGWSNAAELKRDATYDKIESTVLRVLNGFSDDLNIFSELVLDLRDFLDRDKRRNQIVEQRVKEAETGKAVTTTAKQQAQQVINQKASGLRLPSGIGRFLSEVWSKVLVYVCVKHGSASPNWQAQLAVLDDLLWSLQPLDNLKDIDLRDKMRSKLTEEIDAGMQVINLAGAARTEHLNIIEPLLDQVAENDRAFLVEDDPVVAEYQVEEMPSIVLAPPMLTDNLPQEPAEPEFVEQIRQLHEGMWVEMTEKSGNKVRCKLATIIQPGDLYIFVNRRGMKVCEKTRMALACALKDKDLVVLQEAQVFDRALQAVVTNLRKMHDTPVSPSV